LIATAIIGLWLGSAQLPVAVVVGKEFGWWRMFAHQLWMSHFAAAEFFPASLLVVAVSTRVAAQQV
jgi:hypothetical protein